jgi:Putative transposase
MAISNRRLVKLEAGRVTFRYKDYADAHREKTMTLDAGEFLRRFVRHVLPAGFTKVRHHGLLANRFRADRLAVARRSLWTSSLEPLRAPDSVVAILVEPAHLRGCEQCSSRRQESVALPAQSRRGTS